MINFILIGNFVKALQMQSKSEFKIYLNPLWILLNKFYFIVKQYKCTDKKIIQKSALFLQFLYLFHELKYAIIGHSLFKRSGS